LDLNLRMKLVKSYTWSTALNVAETWALWTVIRNTWKVLRCGAGEGWRSVKTIMRAMKKYYTESWRR